MAKIGIALDGILRDTISQLAYVHNKYIAQISQLRIDEGQDSNGKITEIDLEKTPFTDYSKIHEFFNFESVDAMNSFLYNKAALEVFGHADQTLNNIIIQFNQFLMDMEDDGEHEIILVSREAIRSIPATYYFLSKTGCKAKHIRFYTKFEDKWNDVDVLITANPRTLANKPTNKVAVKVKTTYNESTNADFTIDSLMDFINDADLRKKVTTFEITNYEEIK